MRGIRRVLIYSATGLMGMAICFAAQAECVLQMLPPENSTVRSGDYVLDLGEHPEPPTAWEGPIRVSGPEGKTCQIEDRVSIITTPLRVGNKHVLYVPTYSGSNRVLYAVDLRDCHTLWQSPAYGKLETFAHGAFRFDSGKNVALNAECLPQ